MYFNNKKMNYLTLYKYDMIRTVDPKLLHELTINNITLTEAVKKESIKEGNVIPNAYSNVMPNAYSNVMPNAYSNVKFIREIEYKDEFDN